MDGKTDDVKSISRRNFMKNTGMIASAGGIAALGANLSLATPAHAASEGKKKLSTVPL